MTKLFTFIRDEDGAVTVDWVVLTAAIVGLGIAVLTSVRTGATDLAGDIEGNLHRHRRRRSEPDCGARGRALADPARSRRSIQLLRDMT